MDKEVVGGGSLMDTGRKFAAFGSSQEERGGGERRGEERKYKIVR